MHAPTPHSRRFALLVDRQLETRSLIGPALLGHLQLVHSRTGSAALALLQRMAEHFGLALVALTLDDIPGRVVIDTIRLFRPEIPVICLSGSDRISAETGVQRLSREGDRGMLRATTAAIEQARTTFALTGDLSLAARELQRRESGGLEGSQ